MAAHIWAAVGVQESVFGREVESHMAGEVVKGNVGDKHQGQEEVGGRVAACSCASVAPDMLRRTPGSRATYACHLPRSPGSGACKLHLGAPLRAAPLPAAQLLRSNRYAQRGQSLFWYCWGREITLVKRNL